MARQALKPDRRHIDVMDCGQSLRHLVTDGSAYAGREAVCEVRGVDDNTGDVLHGDDRSIRDCRVSGRQQDAGGRDGRPVQGREDPCLPADVVG